MIRQEKKRGKNKKRGRGREGRIVPKVVICLVGSSREGSEEDNGGDICGFTRLAPSGGARAGSP